MSAVRLIMMLPSGDDTNDYFAAHSTPPHHGNYRYYIIIISSIHYRLSRYWSLLQDCQVHRAANKLGIKEREGDTHI